MANEDEESDETMLWRKTLDALLSRGASFTEAVDGANLLLEAHRRRQAESARRSRSSASMRDGVSRRRLS